MKTEKKKKYAQVYLEKCKYKVKKKKTTKFVHAELAPDDSDYSDSE